MTDELYTKYELIDRYLKGQLDGEELLDFEKKKQDPDFADLVRQQDIANRVIITKQLSLLKAKMQADMTQLPLYKKPWFWVCVLVVPIAAGYLYQSLPVDKKDVPSVAIISKEKNTPLDVRDEKQKNTPLNNPSSSVKIASKNQPDLSERQSDRLNEKYTPIPVANREMETTVISTAENQVPKAEYISHSTPCDHKQISVDAESFPACNGKSDGMIVVETQKIKGGKAPYTYSIDGENFSTNYVFRNLESGVYKISVMDKDNCISSIVLKLPTKECKVAAQEVFNPTLGTWSPTVDPSRNASLKILNKAGIVLYSTSIYANQPLEWDGKDHTGTTLPVGYYLFSIHYQNGEEENGYLSIQY